MGKVLDWFGEAWRWIEGVHTALWLAPILWAACLWVVGAVSGVQWFWILVSVPISAVAALWLATLIGDKIGIIPLPVAAARAFDELEGTLWTEMALHSESTAEGRLRWMATGLSRHAPILGRIPPSQRLIVISQQELGRGHIAEGAASLHRYGDPNARYENLSMRKRDLRVAIEEMSENGYA